MANLLRTLINPKQSSTRLITTLNLTPQLFSSPKSILNQDITTNPNFNNDFRSKNDENVDHFETQLSKLQVYPSFSFGHFLNPNLSSGFGLDKVDMGKGMGMGMGMPVLDEVEDPGMMWADSVKKKRKKKMNKHKLNKRRKLLSRKTKKN